MVKRKATEAVEMKLKELTFGTNHVEIGVEVDLEKIKLASLYFASAVLGPRRKRKKEVVDPHWMRLMDDMDSFNTYPWGRLAYEEVLFGLRKDLRARFEEVTNLAKKRKRDPNFSGFGSLHLSGFVQPLQILGYEVYNGVAEAFATRREDADVSLPRMCHWVTRKWHKNHAPSLSDVVASFSSSQCEVITRRMSELMSLGLKIVCNQRCLSPTPCSTPPRSPSHASTPPRSPTPRSPPPRSPPHASTPLRSPTPHSPPPRSPPHASTVTVDTRTHGVTDLG
ncbi:hypothetical protein F511_37036 [Dorcoceras hygrometricum]|uniref:DUF1985 domain-containing protein n=1 Tax=Dorcoceras hygrometricum TaxID=472368 RepID=A0A2Z7AC75_9LAMI|nr:hypothetical protein F511_37036 [Dorcoceras hygrometricum]